MNKPIHVYTITSRNTGRVCYVGKTKFSVQWRFKKHVYYAATSNTFLGKAILKYGADDFVIESVLQTSDEVQAYAAEIRLILEYGTMAPGGYNMTAGGDGGATRTGRKTDAETRARMSQAATLRWASMTAEKRASIAARVATGKTNPSEQTREKIRQANLGKRVSDATRAKLSEAHLGQKRTEETRAKISLVKTGVRRGPLNAGWRAKIGAAQVGRVHTNESKAKIANASGRPENLQRLEWMRDAAQTPEARAKRIASMKRTQANKKARAGADG